MSASSSLDLKKVGGKSSAASPRRAPGSPFLKRKEVKYGTLPSASPRTRAKPAPAFSPAGLPASTTLSALSQSSSSPRRPASPSRPSLTRAGSSPPPAKDRRVTARYITTDMLQKCAREENLAQVTVINLTFSPQQQMKIKYIENLEGLRYLRILNLNGNGIEKIEKLQTLSQLTELHLASNSLTRIEGLEHLSNLAVLDVGDNQIARLPMADVMRKWVRLRDLRLAGNQLNTLRDISRLKACTNLAKLTLARNPLTDASHWWLFAVYHLRTLEQLDDEAVMGEHRTEAKERFSVAEVNHLEEELAKQDEYILLMEEELTTATEQCQRQDKQLEDQNEERLRLRRTLSEVEQDLSAKTELLNSKSAELARACRKHYELEQEMAFSKLDTKFDPRTWMRNDADDSDEELESPYLGRARFKMSSLARERNLQAAPQNAVLHSVSPSHVVSDRSHTPSGLATPQHATMSPEGVQNGVDSAALQSALAQRNAELQNAVNVAKKLGEELKGTKAQLADAEKELKRLQAEPDGRQLEEEVNALQQQVAVWQKACEHAKQQLAASQDDVQTLDQELARARQSERQVREQSALASDELSAELQRQIAALQDQLRSEQRRSHELQGALDAEKNNASRLKGQNAALEQQLADAQEDANHWREEYEHALADAGKEKRRADDLADQLQALRQADLSAAQQGNENVHELQQQILLTSEEMRTLRVQLEQERRLREEASQQLESALAEQRQRRAVAGREGEEVRHALQVKDSEIAALRKALEQANQRLQALDGQQQSALGQLQADNLALQQALEEAGTQLPRLQAEYERQLGDLRAQLAEKSERLRGLEESLSSLRHPHALDGTLLSRLSHLVGSLEEQSRVPDSLPPLEDDPESPRARQVSSALSEFMQAHASQPPSARGSAEVATMTQQLTDEPAVELGSRLTRLMEALAKEAELAQRQHAEAARECKHLQKELDAVRRQLKLANDQRTAQATSADDELEQVRQEVGELQELVEAGRQRHAQQLQTGERDLADARAEIAAQQTALDELGAQIDRMAAEKETQDSKIASLEDQLVQMRAEREELEAELQAAQDQARQAEDTLQDELTGQQTHLQQYSTQLEAKMKNALQRLAALQQELEREADTRQQLEDAMARVSQDRDALAAAVKKLQDEIHRLRSQLLAKDDELLRAREALESSNVSHHDLSALAQAIADQQHLVAGLQQYLPQQAEQQQQQQQRRASHSTVGTSTGDGLVDPRLDAVLRELAHVRQALDHQQRALDGLRRSDEAPSSAESHIHIHTSPASGGGPVSYHIPYAAGHTATPTSTRSRRDASTMATPAAAAASAGETATSARHSSRVGSHREQQQQQDPSQRQSPHVTTASLATRPTQTEAVTSASAVHTQSPAVSRQPRAARQAATATTTSSYDQHPSDSLASMRSVSPIAVSASMADGLQARPGIDTATQTMYGTSAQPVHYPMRPASALVDTSGGLDGSYLAPGVTAPRPGQSVHLSHRPASTSFASRPGASPNMGQSHLFDVSHRHADGSVVETPGRLSYADLAPPRSAGVGAHAAGAATHVHVHPPVYNQVAVDPHHPQQQQHQYATPVAGRFCNIAEHSLLEDQVSQLQESLDASRRATRQAHELLRESTSNAQSLHDTSHLNTLYLTRQRELTDLDEHLTREHKELLSTRQLTSQAKATLEEVRVSSEAAEKRLTGVQRVSADITARQQAARQELEELQTAIGQEQGRQTALLQQRGDLSQGVSSHEQQLAQLANRLQDVERRAGAAESDLSRKHHEQALAESRLSATLAELHGHQQRLSESKQAIRDTEMELSVARQHGQREAERLEEVQAEVSRCDQEVASAQNQLKELRSLLETSRAEATLASEAAQSSRLSELQRDISESMLHLQGVRTHAQQLEAATLSRQRQTAADQGHLQASVTKLRSQQKEVEAALSEARGKRSEEESKLSASRHQVHQVEQEADIVRDRIDRMERDNAAAAAESSRQQQALSLILAQVREAENQLEQKRRDELELECSVSKLKQHVHDCEGALPTALQNQAAVTQRTELAQSTLRSLLERCRVTEEQLTAARQRLAQENERLAVVRDQQLAAQNVQSELQMQCEKLKTLTQSLRTDQTHLESIANGHDSDVIRELKAQLKRVTTLCEQRDQEFSVLQQRYSVQREEKKRVKETLRSERAKKRSAERELTSHQQFVDDGLQKMRKDIHGLHEAVVAGSQPTTTAISRADSFMLSPSRHPLSEHSLLGSGISSSDLTSPSPLAATSKPTESLHDQAREQQQQELMQTKLDAQLSRHEESLRQEQLKAQGSVGLLSSHVSSLERSLLHQRSLSSTLERPAAATVAVSPTVSTSFAPSSLASRWQGVASGSAPTYTSSSVTDFSKMASRSPMSHGVTSTVPTLPSAQSPSRSVAGASVGRSVASLSAFGSPVTAKSSVSTRTAGGDQATRHRLHQHDTPSKTRNPLLTRQSSPAGVSGAFRSSAAVNGAASLIGAVDAFSPSRSSRSGRSPSVPREDAAGPSPSPVDYSNFAL